MKILLKHAHIVDPNSPYNGSVKDVLITDGFFEKIDDSIQPSDDVFQLSNVSISPGWVDIFSHGCDPGFEYKETLESLANSAASGGFTSVFILPNTNPAIHDKTQAEYIVQSSKAFAVTLYPLGAITKNCEGKELAEMYDMQNSGAIAFTDGIHPVQSAGLLTKALEYVKAFKGTVIQIPSDKSIGQHGLMHEGIVSTLLGLPGVPAMAEELMVARDIKLVRYTNSKLHFTGITTAKSLEYIQHAKEDGLNVTCSVTPYHLFFCDEDLGDYDTNLKVEPPLRTRKDMVALREAVKSGLIDCIASHHIPQDWDSKTCEFELAKTGMIGLQTAFSVVTTAITGLNPNNIAELFSMGARKIFGLYTHAIKENTEADITFFNMSDASTLTKETNKSKSANSPFLNQQLGGKVIGVYTKGKLTLNK